MYTAKLESQLGFDRIRKIISDRCSTEYAAEKAAMEEFSTDVKEIRHRLVLTDEMRLIVMFEESFPSNGYIDCIVFLEMLENPGANIDLVCLGKLRTMLETIRKITSFFAGIKDGVYPNLKRMVSGVGLFPEVLKEIDRILDKYGNVKDTASDELYDIRKKLKEKEGAVSKRISIILKKAQGEGIVDADAAVARCSSRSAPPTREKSRASSMTNRHRERPRSSNRLK